MGAAVDHKRNLDAIVTCAKSRFLAHITYKKPGDDWVTERYVEPYSLSNSQGNIIVRTWQVDPVLCDEAWRCFRVDRMVLVRNSGQFFSPRTTVTIDDGIITEFRMDDDGNAGSSVSLPSPAEKYFRYIEKAMLDGEMKKGELIHAKKLAMGLRPTQIKAQHALAYANLIDELTMDGDLSEDEEDLLTNMRVFLMELGWAP